MRFPAATLRASARAPVRPGRRRALPPGIEACVIRDEEPDTGTSRADQPDRLGVLNVAGDLTPEGLDLLRLRCRAEVAAQVTVLVIDFTGMTDFPSALFGLLAETGASLRNRGARLHIIGLYEAIDLIAGAGEQPTSASSA